MTVPARRFSWTLFLDANPDPMDDTPLRWWQGREDLSFEGQTWLGSASEEGDLMELGDIEITKDLAGVRATARVAVTGAAIARLRFADLGAVTIRIGWVYSDDGGLTWARVPRQFEGRLSETAVADGVLTASIETWLGDTDRGKPLTWSHESQRARAAAAGRPVEDNAFSAASRLEADRSIRWPPGAA